MGYDRIDLKTDMRSFELDTINSIAKYLGNFNDSLLVEDEFTLEEIRLLERIFA